MSPLASPALGATSPAGGGGEEQCAALRATSPVDARGVEPAPVLVLATGNPSRGDDAVGPLLAEKLEGAALPGVEVLVEFQLQVEHALDLQGRRRVIFVDACVGGSDPVCVRPLRAGPDFRHTSHALEPAEVLETFRRITGQEPPPAWLLGIGASQFELGAGLSARTEAACNQAWPVLLGLCRS